MKRLIARTLKWVITGGLCGFFIMAPTANASEPDKEQSMTVIKKWTISSDVNGDFEADRRAWLASLRQKKNQEKPDLNEIIVEKLDDRQLSSYSER